MFGVWMCTGMTINETSPAIQHYPADQGAPTSDHWTLIIKTTPRRASAHYSSPVARMRSINMMQLHETSISPVPIILISKSTAGPRQHFVGECSASAAPKADAFEATVEVLRVAQPRCAPGRRLFWVREREWEAALTPKTRSGWRVLRRAASAEGWRPDSLGSPCLQPSSRIAVTV